MFNPGKLTDLLPSADCEGVAKPNPYTLESLRDWLATMPRDGEYDYRQMPLCALGLYTIDLGGHLADSRYHAGGVSVPACILGAGEVSDEMHSLFNVVRPEPWTFGGALYRCERALQSSGGL